MMAMLPAALMTVPSSVFAGAGIEIVPVAVWQGKPSRPWSVTKLQDIRRSFPGLKIAHAVDASSLVRGGEQQTVFRDNFARSIVAGDDVLLHAAPWKSLVEKAGVAFKTKPTAFGAPIDLDNCLADCGLELSFSAFSPADARSIIATSKGILSDSGFGAPKAIYFDEGIVSADLRAAGRQAEFSQDWSGIEMTQLSESLGLFPVYNWNKDNISVLSLGDTSAVFANGLVLDHVRFATHAEVGDLEGAVKLYKEAVGAAKKDSRVARIAIVFNVEDLIHTYGFVSEAMSKAAAVAKEAGVPVQEWTALNTSWNIDIIRAAKANADIAVAATAPSVADPASSVSDEPEFIPSDESDEPSVEAH
jgi:hypothetical protein